MYFCKNLLHILNIYSKHLQTKNKYNFLCVLQIYHHEVICLWLLEVVGRGEREGENWQMKTHYLLSSIYQVSWSWPAFDRRNSAICSATFICLWQFILLGSHIPLVQSQMLLTFAAGQFITCNAEHFITFCWCMNHKYLLCGCQYVWWMWVSVYLCCYFWFCFCKKPKVKFCMGIWRWCRWR